MTIAIEVCDRDASRIARDRSPTLALAHEASRAIVPEHSEGMLVGLRQDEIGAAVVIEVCDSEPLRPERQRDRCAGTERRVPVAQRDEQLALLIDRCDIELAVAIEIGQAEIDDAAAEADERHAVRSDRLPCPS